MLTRFVQIILSIVVVAVIAAFYAVLNLDLNDYKKQIESAAYDATGRTLILEGDVSLTWSLIPTLSIKQARFANAGWGMQDDMVSFGELELRLALYPLFQRDIEITKVSLSQPVIVIETNEQGVGNWVLEQQDKPESTEPESENEEAAIQSAIIHHVSIEDATIIYKDGVTEEVKRVEVDELTVDMANLVSPFSLVIEALVDDMPVSLAGDIGGLQALMDNNTATVELEGEVAGISLAITGDIEQPHAGKGVSLALKIKSDDKALAALSGQTLPEFGDITLEGTISNAVEGEAVQANLTTTLPGATLWVQGQIDAPQQMEGVNLQLDLKTDTDTLARLSDADIPPLGNVTLTGAVSGDAKVMKLNRFELIAGENDLAGDIQFTAGDVPTIEAELNSNRLDLTMLDSGEDEVEEKSPPSDKVFSADPLVLEGLKQVNASVTLKAKTLLTTAAHLEHMNIGIDLQDGHLKVSPFTAGFAGSQLVAELDLDAKSPEAILKSTLQVNGFKLTEVDALKDSIEGGNSDVYIEASGQGTSVAQLMAGLNGKAIMKVGQSQIADGTLDLLGADFLTKLVDMINPFAKQTKGTELGCAVINMAIKDGVATAKKGIAVQTKNLNILGNGTINLKSEQLNIDFKPKARSGVGLNLSQLAGLVKVGGTLAKPSAQLDTVAVLETGVTGAAAVATGGLSVVAQGLVDKATAKNPCDVALGITKSEEP